MAQLGKQSWNVGEKLWAGEMRAEAAMKGWAGFGGDDFELGSCRKIRGVVEIRSGDEIEGRMRGRDDVNCRMTWRYGFSLSCLPSLQYPFFSSG